MLKTTFLNSNLQNREHNSFFYSFPWKTTNVINDQNHLTIFQFTALLTCGFGVKLCHKKKKWGHPDNHIHTHTLIIWNKRDQNILCGYLLSTYLSSIFISYFLLWWWTIIQVIWWHFSDGKGRKWVYFGMQIVGCPSGAHSLVPSFNVLLFPPF